MQEFTDEQLRAYIQAVFASCGLEIAISDRPVRQHEKALGFRGKMPGQRKERTFVLPLDISTPGVFTARTIICGDVGSKMEWFVNGQAAKNCHDVAVIGSTSDKAVSLHFSKEMLHGWTHSRLLTAPEGMAEKFTPQFDADYNHYLKTGRYADEVSIGTYVDKGAATLTLELEPAVADSGPALAP